MKIDIKALNVLCNLLSFANEKHSKDPNSDRNLIFQAVIKILENKYLFAQISKYFQLDLFLKEVAYSPAVCLPLGLTALHSIVFLKLKDDVAEEENKFLFSQLKGFDQLLRILKKFTHNKEIVSVRKTPN